jgi:hypothetical protein
MYEGALIMRGMVAELAAVGRGRCARRGCRCAFVTSSPPVFGQMMPPQTCPSAATPQPVRGGPINEACGMPKQYSSASIGVPSRRTARTVRKHTAPRITVQMLD